jgi:hypothetical protein
LKVTLKDKLNQFLKILKLTQMMKRILYWLPRILGILAILFMMMFSLDCFENGGTDALLCLLMHNIPALIIVAVLVISWKWELIGGILFILGFIAGGIFFDGFGKNPASLIVIAPFLLTGILFILYYYLYGSKKTKPELI